MKVYVDGKLVQKKATKALVVTNAKELMFTSEEFDYIYLNSKEVVAVVVK